MTEEQPETRRRFPVIPVAVAVAVVLAVVAYVASDGEPDRPERDAVSSEHTEGDGTVEQLEQVRDVSFTGNALPDFVRGTPDAAVGTPAPTISGQSFDGEEVTIGGAGSPQLVFVVAHWCPHCQKEVPVIARWMERGGPPDGVELRAISTAVNPDAPNYPPSEWLDGEGWAVPTIADDARFEAAQALGLSGYPFFVAIRADGSVAARASGELTVEQIEALVALATGAT
ncbi:MAG TPA: TlpA disulfide reductase family protein [Acidimicrobiales bacterium]